MERRIRMHTAEHILTTVMHDLFASPRNLEMHLGEKKSKCDYAVPRALTPEGIAKIERAVNEVIDKDIPVTAEVLPIKQARENYDLWKVPQEATTIRIVKIGDFDSTPCSGEHVSHTGEIGRFHIRSYTMKDETTVRIRFGLEDPITG